MFGKVCSLPITVNRYLWDFLWYEIGITFPGVTSPITDQNFVLFLQKIFEHFYYLPYIVSLVDTLICHENQWCK